MKLEEKKQAKTLAQKKYYSQFTSLSNSGDRSPLSKNQMKKQMMKELFETKKQDIPFLRHKQRDQSGLHKLLTVNKDPHKIYSTPDIDSAFILPKIDNSLSTVTLIFLFY
jgi:hypothetical protein